MSVISTVIPAIAARFNGPSSSAQGGYACGVFSAYHPPTAHSALSVVLLSPPPLDSSFDFFPGESRSHVRHAETDIAIVTVHTGTLPSINPVSFVDAETASRRFTGLTHHPFPTCFACGHGRNTNDGLALMPGAVPGLTDTVACIWTPRADDADPSGEIAAPVIWAALDCPGGWTSDVNVTPMVLSRMTASIIAHPAPGESCVIVGKLRRRQGRTMTVDTALFDGTQKILAKAMSLWVAVPDGLHSPSASFQSASLRLDLKE